MAGTGQPAEKRSPQGAQWSRPYPRELGAFPLPGLRASKYWPPVGRVDNVWGDRNLFCSCAPVQHAADDAA